MTIKKGDTVAIIIGKDRGKTGKVIRVFPDADKVVVEGLNMVKRHVRPKRQGEKGEIVTVPRPLRSSNVQLWCGRCGKGVRARRSSAGTRKVRVCARCGNEL